MKFIVIEKTVKDLSKAEKKDYYGLPLSYPVHCREIDAWEAVKCVAQGKTVFDDVTYAKASAEWEKLHASRKPKPWWKFWT